MRRDDVSEIIKDVMSSSPKTLTADRSVREAAALMRDDDVGAVVVTQGGGVFGVLTDRDIVVRGLAEGLDPSSTRIGQICSREVTSVRPTDPVAHAVRLMKDRAIRRLPVVGESGDVVGLVSIGDLAREREPGSVLGKISTATPNT